VKRGADIRRGLANVVPVTAFRNDEAMDFGEQRRIRLAVDLLRLGSLFILDIADAFEEQQWEDVALPVGPIDS